MSAIRTPEFICQAMCAACGRVLVDEFGGFCPACDLVQHHIRRGESIADDQRRLER